MYLIRLKVLDFANLPERIPKIHLIKSTWHMYYSYLPKIYYKLTEGFESMNEIHCIRCSQCTCQWSRLEFHSMCPSSLSKYSKHEFTLLV